MLFRDLSHKKQKCINKPSPNHTHLETEKYNDFSKCVKAHKTELWSEILFSSCRTLRRTTIALYFDSVDSGRRTSSDQRRRHLSHLIAIVEHQSGSDCTSEANGRAAKAARQSPQFKITACRVRQKLQAKHRIKSTLHNDRSWLQLCRASVVRGICFTMGNSLTLGLALHRNEFIARLLTKINDVNCHGLDNFLALKTLKTLTSVRRNEQTVRKILWSDKLSLIKYVTPASVKDNT